MQAAAVVMPRTARRAVAWILMVLAAGLVPWTAYLGFTLPRRFTAHHWDVAWVGFDVLLMLALTGTAWAAWARRQIFAGAAIVTATLLVCDAWFDIVLSLGSRGAVPTIAAALLVELPIAVGLGMMARRVMLGTFRRFLGSSGFGPARTARKLVDIPLLFSPEDPGGAEGTPGAGDTEEPGGTVR